MPGHFSSWADDNTEDQDIDLESLKIAGAPDNGFVLSAPLEPVKASSGVSQKENIKIVNQSTVVASSSTSNATRNRDHNLNQKTISDDVNSSAATPTHTTPKLPRRSARKLKRDAKPPSPPKGGEPRPAQSPKLEAAPVTPIVENGDHKPMSQPIQIAKVHSYVKNGTTFFTAMHMNNPSSPQLTPSSPPMLSPITPIPPQLPVVPLAPNQTMTMSPMIPNGIGPHLGQQLDNWSTTPTSTSTSITNQTKPSFKKFKCHSVPNFRNFSPRKSPKKPVVRNDFGKTPLQELNEYTQQRLLAAPTFEELPAGPPFRVICHVRELSLITEGTALSKKEARQNASVSMLQLLNSDPEVNPESGIACDLRKVNLDEVRNPIGFLQEYLQKRGDSLPIYSSKEERRPPFICKVRIDSLAKHASAMGMKKSEAKTNAAIRMIHLLRGEKFIQSVQPRHILTASLSPPSESASGSTKSRHQVTLLQEFCQKRKLWAPQYSYFQTGLTHGKGKNKQLEVTCVCSISALNLETRETRKSQKEARRAAADHMLNILYRNYPHDAFSY